MSLVCEGYDRVNQYRVEYSVSSRDEGRKDDWGWGFAFGKTSEAASVWFKNMICNIRDLRAKDDHGEVIGLDTNRIKIIAINKVEK